MSGVKRMIENVVEALEANNYDWDLVASMMGMDPDEVFEIAVDYCEIPEDELEGY